MESGDAKKHSEGSHDERSSLTQEEKYLTASYAALMAEMAKEEDYDFEENDDPISDEEAEVMFNN